MTNETPPKSGVKLVIRLGPKPDEKKTEEKPAPVVNADKKRAREEDFANSNGDDSSESPAKKLKVKVRLEQTPTSSNFSINNVKTLITSVKDVDKEQIFWYPVTDELVPGYSTVVTNPMDLSTIEKRADEGKYTTWKQAMDDFELMFSNAYTFNPAGSYFHKEAKRIHKATTQAQAKIEKNESLETPKKGRKPKKVEPEKPKANGSSLKSEKVTYRTYTIPAPDRKRLYVDVVKQLVELDENGIFLEPVSEEAVPGYHEVIKQPMDLTTLQKRVSTSKIVTLADFVENLERIFTNAMYFNGEDTLFYQEAVRLLQKSRELVKSMISQMEELEAQQQQKQAQQVSPKGKQSKKPAKQDEKQQLEADSMDIEQDVPVPLPPSASVEAEKKGPDMTPLDPEKLKELMLLLWTRLSSADQYDIFAQPVSKEEVPDYYQKIKEPMDFATIKQKLDENKYSTYEELEADFELTFANCKQYNPNYTPYWKEAARLQRMLRSIKKAVIMGLEVGKEFKDIAALHPKASEEKRKKQVQAEAEQEAKQEEEQPAPEGSENGEETRTRRGKKREQPAPDLKKKFTGLAPQLRKLLDDLVREDKQKFFIDPVDLSQVPDYTNIVSTPMDFTTMKNKLRKDEYPSLEAFKQDFELICKNAMTYNKPNTIYHKEAGRLLPLGLKKIEAVSAKMQKEADELAAQLRAEAEQKEKQRKERRQERERQKQLQKQQEQEKKQPQQEKEDEENSRKRKYVKSGMYKRDKEGQFMVKDPKVRREGVQFARKVINTDAVASSPSVSAILNPWSVHPPSSVMLVKSCKEFVDPIAKQEYERICNASVSQFFNQEKLNELIQLRKKKVQPVQQFKSLLLDDPFLNELVGSSVEKKELLKEIQNMPIEAPLSAEETAKVCHQVGISVPTSSKPSSIITSLIRPSNPSSLFVQSSTPSSSNFTSPFSFQIPSVSSAQQASIPVPNPLDDSSDAVMTESSPRQETQGDASAKLKSTTSTRSCSNCGTSDTPNWRRSAAEEQATLCNACGLYLQKNKHHRPVHLANTNNLIMNQQQSANIMQFLLQQQQRK